MEAVELIDQRIDHAFLRPGQPNLDLSVDRVELLGHAINGLDSSEHKAVCCDVSRLDTVGTRNG